MNYSEQLYNEVLEKQNQIQTKLKSEEDIKKAKQLEKDFMLLSALLINLTKYNAFKNRV